MSKRLYRCDDELVGGVAGGLGDYLDIDRSIVRIIWAILIFAYGIGLLPYIIMWIIVPEYSEEDLEESESERHSEKKDE